MIGLIRVYRPVVGEEMWEIPGGRIHADEAPLEAAKRELIEETGLEGENWEYLGGYYPLPGLTNEKLHLFTCKVPPASQAILSQHEQILEMKYFGPEDVQDLIRSQKIKSSRDAFALFLAINP